MANVIFTNKCNIQCPFCFATENNAKDCENTEQFTIADTWELTNFLTINTPFKFCGGEPSINPEIDKAIDLILKSKRNVTLLTNGLWPNSFQEYIMNIPPRDQYRITYLFNVLEPSFYTSAQIKKLHHTLNTINPAVASLGFTIYKKDFEYEYLFELSKAFNIKRIRWSITAPNIQGPDYLLENDFEFIASRFYEFYMKAIENGITVVGDCGYLPPCFFTSENFKKISLLSENSRNFVRFKCNNSPVDIDNKGIAWRCYGLYSVLKQPIKNFASEDELRAYFNRRIRLLDNIFPYQRCKTCEYWLKGCSGGCYAIRIKKALSIDPDLCIFPIDDDNAILDCKPQRIENLILRNYKMKKFIAFNTKIVEDPDENMISFIEEVDGKKSISELIDMWKENFDSYDIAKATVIEMCRKVFEMDMITINYDYRIELEGN